MDRETQDASKHHLQDKRPLLLTLIALALAAALLLWRGLNAGVGLASQSPAPGAQRASGLSTIRLQFDRPMDTTQAPEVRLTPPVTGTMRWLDERTLSFRPAAALLPATEYFAEVAAGLRAQDGRELQRPVRWQFRTRAARILYLGWDDQDRVQLYVVEAEGGAPRALTAVERRVLDFALAPDGRSVVFTMERGEAPAGSDLWSLSPDAQAQEDSEPQRLLDCGGDYCSGPVWRPDGARLLYERRVAESPGETPHPPRLWWLVPESGETAPLFDDDQLLGRAPRFSNDGEWLALVVPLVQAMQFYHFPTEDLIEMPNEIGEPVAWHPWQPALVTGNIQYVGETVTAHLFRIDMPEATATDLTGEALSNDAAPAWSPDGQWIVFGRRLPRTGMGRQLWVMRSDGSAAWALTEDVVSNFGAPSWSPDGRQILVQRFNIDQPDGDPGIWLVDVDDGELHEVTPSGFQPVWLP